MAKKKKRAAPRTPRLNTYERSLQKAEARLEEAEAERLACALQLQSLDQEIPYLQGIIRALRPLSPSEAPPPIERRPRQRVPGVPDHLQRFMPGPGRHTVVAPAASEPPSSEDREDEFLPEETGTPIIE